MQPDDLSQSLESLDQARPLLQQWNLRDYERGWRILSHLANAVGAEALRELCHPLGRLLPRCPDPDMSLNNLERFLANPEGARQLPTLLEGRARSLETLLQLLSTSQYFSDLLVANPGYLDMLRVPLRNSPSQREMQDQLQHEVASAFEDSAVLRAFRRFRQRQILRIGTNDIIRDRPLEEITRDISRVADAALEVALATALRHLGNRFGQPYSNAGRPARCVILAFGKLGGQELNYSSDIDLMFLYDEDGATGGPRATHVGNDEFFARVTSEVVRLLSAHTDRGQAYRVDLRLRPEGLRGPLARSLASTLSYYDTLGRTWERQALIKVRPVAGDLKLGEEFIRAIEPFVYRKYLSFAEINEIKALKRRIEQKTGQAGTSNTEVKTGHGGIRDVEFTIQFLQLLNGGDLSEVRQRNTLLAMVALDRVGCLTDQEFHILDDAYRFLRKTEHRLQLLFDLQTHQLPDGIEEMRKLALRMGYGQSRAVRGQGSGVSEDGDAADSSLAPDPSPLTPAEELDSLGAFLNDYREKTDLNRRILDHLLHQTFQGENGQAEPESDLLLDPDPDPQTVRTVLGRYPFRDVQGAYHNLNQLATESVPFLSTRRCRQFLASIAPQLLRALAEAPDPDMALVNLEKVTASLGGKGVLWELFSFNAPSLKLYVDLCAWSQYLSEILINNPGMIDELLDSLVLNQPRTAQELRAELAELCRGAADPEPILHSFQDKEILRIGVRDVLGKDTVQATTAALSDLAETILAQIAVGQEPAMARRFGVPYLAEGGARAGRPSRYTLLGLGKLGGRELSYHSDLDLILVYEGDGHTGPPAGASRFDRFELTDNFHFFTELTQRIIRTTSYLGPLGRLYQVDMRLRPTGKSGSLVSPLAEFRRYYEEGGAQLWERQALTRARVVYGDPEFSAEVMDVVARGAYGLDWRPELADEIRSMRERLEASRSERDVKRGFGGIVDVEFLVQLFQLKYGKELPAVRAANTWEALDALRGSGLLSTGDYATLRAGYDYLRLVESRLRIVHNRSLDELPEDREDLEKLARRLGCETDGGMSAADRFLQELDRHTSQTREVFLRVVARERN
ncbi:MAG TPA: bifunctional [glutamate--ammonia ligase]-adenylyl-L-tyrosine phosphorylase/[glutamate--ammonia-ligase] adenylyltransferase [Gemmataceae bacterium]|jgi:glutamate-ammonia-ligase adenylyltransferase|nr:bifunctional [glutamate--ammonia ligase]-adenylyl-L-tyrosine phosphorylase/[glutamate--ammonia-ligase] adenylyltransferase [Gemmataceae bacterium]